MPNGERKETFPLASEKASLFARFCFSADIVHPRLVVKALGGGGFVGDAHGDERHGDAFTAQNLLHAVGARLGGVAAAPAGAVAEVCCL